MQRLGGGGYTRKNKRGGGVVGGFGPTNPSCGCDMQAGWPKFLTENIPMKGGSCGIPPIPNYYQGGGMNQRGGSCPTCSGLPLPQPFQSGGGFQVGYNSNPVPDACPFPGTGYCGFYARGGANYGEPMYLQAKLRGGGCGCSAWKGGSRVTTDQRGGYKPTKKNRAALKKWRKGQSIGFTMTSSLKAKGLIPRTSRKHRGKKVVSAKYL